MIATVTLWNRSHREITGVHLLVKRKGDVRRSRLFGATADLAPGETRTIKAFPVDRNLYDFKFATNGCELEDIAFSDGTSWEQGSPL